MSEIRPEASAEFAAIRDVHLRAFAPSRVEADLVEALRASRAHVPDLCLVSVDEDTVVGHIAFSRARLACGLAVLALAPMGVLPERQRQGVGAGLVREALGRAGQTDFPLVVAVGHPGYYPRLGFEPAEPLGLDAPFSVPAEAWMAHRLPAYVDEARGMVRYPVAFT